MARKGTQGYFMLLGWVTITNAGNHECLPYARKPQDEADEDMRSLLIQLPNNAVNSNLCEELT